MLGRSTYTPDELARARALVAAQLAAHAQAGPTDPAFDTTYFATAVLALDRLFVHRVRSVSGKDTNPLTEVELLAESLLTGATFETNKVIKYVPAKAIVPLEPGAPIELTAAGYERLATAFLDEIQARCVTG